MFRSKRGGDATFPAGPRTGKTIRSLKKPKKGVTDFTDEVGERVHNRSHLSAKAPCVPKEVRRPDAK